MIRFGNKRTGRVVKVLEPREYGARLSRARRRGKRLSPDWIKVRINTHKQVVAKLDDSWKWQRLGPDEAWPPKDMAAYEDDQEAELDDLDDLDGLEAVVVPDDDGDDVKADDDGEAAPAPAATGDVDSAVVRAWAREQGIEVPDRGRLSADVVDQYRAATGA